jgi:hypothetical protein
MEDVRIDGKRRDVASTWDELSAKQLLLLMPVLYGKYPDLVRQRLDALRILLGVSTSLLLRFKPVQMIELKPLTEFLLTGECTLSRQLLPVVRLGLRRYHGAGAGFDNLRFLEFVFADSFYQAYLDTKEEAWLDKLLAVLYRPARLRGGRAAGDWRQPFNDNLLERDTARLARLPQATKLAILTWYRGCRYGLQQRYPLVFTPSQEQQAASRPDGWAYVLREVSGGPFGDFDATGRQYAHTVLAKMQDDLQRALDLKPAAQ